MLGRGTFSTIKSGGLFLPALVLMVILSGCAGSNSQGTGVSSLSSGNCKQMQRKMNSLLAKGKGEGREYRDVLDTYMGRGCAKSG